MSATVGSTAAQTFETWMKAVNAVILAKTGVEADDLPDFTFMDEWEDGATPSQAAKAAIAWAKEF